MSLGERLKWEREKRNWSQVYVAKRIGITNAVLSNYERDIRDPDTETLTKLADLYEVTTDYLLGRTNNRETHVTVNVAGQEISLTNNEYEVFKELKKHPIVFNDLQTDPERKIKQLIKMWEVLKLQLEQIEGNNED